MLFLSLVLMIIALARPVMDKKEQEIEKEIIPVVVAIDVSKSMRAKDIYPNRLEFARNKTLELLKSVDNHAVGVLLFAKSSFILSPLTTDFLSLEYLLKNLDTNVEFDNGSNILSLLESSNRLLRDYKSKNIILLSDGGNLDDYEKEIEYANNSDLNIYVIAVAGDEPVPIPSKNGDFLTNSDGNIVTVSLNKNISKLAKSSGGGYINFSYDSADLKAIISDINSRSEKERSKVQKIKTYTELFYYPLALSIFILLLALSSLPRFKRGSKSLVLVVATLMTLPKSSQALVFDFQNIEEANSAYEKKEYKKAQENFEELSLSPQRFYNLGNSYYKQGKYKEAITEYKKVITANKELEHKKLHNIGNSYVKLNDLQKAKEFYESALKQKYDKDTKDNLDMVNRALDKKEQEKNQNKEQNQKNNNDKKEENREQNSKNQDSKDSNNQKNEQNQQNQKDKQNSKNSDKSDKQDSKESKEEQKDKDKKDTTASKNDDKNREQKESQSAQSKGINEKEISNLEEKKWMKILNSQKAPTLLKRVHTPNSSDEGDSPW